MLEKSCEKSGNSVTGNTYALGNIKEILKEPTISTAGKQLSHFVQRPLREFFCYYKISSNNILLSVCNNICILQRFAYLQLTQFLNMLQKSVQHAANLHVKE